MILVDTSAWIEFLRKSGHPVHLAPQGEHGAQADRLLDRGRGDP